MFSPVERTRSDSGARKRSCVAYLCLRLRLALARPSWRGPHSLLLPGGPTPCRRRGGARPRPLNETAGTPSTRDRPKHKSSRNERRTRQTPRRRERHARKTRRSVVTNSLFGLGAPELVVILGLGAFVLGPDKLASMAKDFGKVAGELKDVPKEFKEGLEEGEAAKAARMLEEGDTKEESA